MRVAAGIFLVLFAACVGSPPRYLPPNGTPAQLTLEVGADFDATWRAVVETFAETTTSIETIEKASGFVAAAKPVNFARVDDLPAHVDFGSLNGWIASTYVQARPHVCSARLRYNVFVVPVADHQHVRVNTSWTGHADLQGTSVVYRFDLVGNSTGAFERALLEVIAGKLKQSSAAIVVTQAFSPSKYEKEPRIYGAESASNAESEGWVRHGTGF